MDAPRSGFDELRDEAIACLALADLRPGKLAIDVPPGASSPVFDGMFRRYALVDRQGIASVHTIGQAGPIARLADVGGAPRELRLSPDGRSLAIVLPEGLQVREVEGGGLVWKVSGRVRQAEFAADSRRIAVGLADGTVVVADVAAGREVARFSVGFQPLPLAMRPDGKQLAVADESRDVGVEIWDLEPPRKVTNLRPGERGPVAALGWSPDGGRLGIGLVLGAIAEIWDVADRREVVTLEGHAQQVNVLRFHPDGDLVLTCSWDGTARLWDAGTGRSVVHWQSLVGDPHFGRDGRACGVVKVGGETRVLEVEPGREYRTLVAGLGPGQSEYYQADISPDDLLAVGMEDGVRLWELDTGRELAFLPIGKCQTTSFVAGKRGRELLSCGPGGLHRWPIVEEAGARPPPDRDAPESPTADGADDGRGRARWPDRRRGVRRLGSGPRARPGGRGGPAHAPARLGEFRPGQPGWAVGGDDRVACDERQALGRPDRSPGRRAGHGPPELRLLLARRAHDDHQPGRPVPVPRGPVVAGRPGAAVGDPVLSGLGRLLAGREVRRAGDLAGGRASHRRRIRPDAGPAAGPGCRPGAMAGHHGRRGEAGGDRGILQGDPPVGPPEDRPGPRRHRPAGRTGRVSPVRRARPDVGDPGRGGVVARRCRGGARPRQDRPVSEAA